MSIEGFFDKILSSESNKFYGQTNHCFYISDLEEFNKEDYKGTKVYKTKLIGKGVIYYEDSIFVIDNTK